MSKERKYIDTRISAVVRAVDSTTQHILRQLVSGARALELVHKQGSRILPVGCSNSSS